MKTNYVLIDYENVQPSDIDKLDREEFKVMVFFGSKQTKIDLNLSIVMHALGERAEYIKINGTGSNALDFHICFYIGRIAAVDSNAYFHIVSKDTGFDPLISHLKKLKIMASRVTKVCEIQILKLNGTMSRDEKYAAIIESLKRRGHSRPRKVSTLASTIVAIFGKSIEQTEASSLVQGLKDRGYITVDKLNKVTYNLP